MKQLYECMNCVFWDEDSEKYYSIPCRVMNPITQKKVCDNKLEPKPIKKVTKDYQYIVLNCPIEKNYG